MVEEYDTPKDGDVTDYEWIDGETLIVTVEAEDGNIYKETYKFKVGEQVE